MYNYYIELLRKVELIKFSANTPQTLNSEKKSQFNNSISEKPELKENS